MLRAHRRLGRIAICNLIEQRVSRDASKSLGISFKGIDAQGKEKSKWRKWERMANSIVTKMKNLISLDIASNKAQSILTNRKKVLCGSINLYTKRLILGVQRTIRGNFG